MGRLLISFCLLMLGACQAHVDYKVEKAEKEKKLEDAISYHLQLGLGYLKQGDMPRAKRKLLTAQELAPQSAEVSGALAYFFEKTGEVPEAEKYYRKAMALAPGQGAAQNNYGAFLCRLNKHREAEAWFLKAVKDQAYIHSAGAYENAGLCMEAISDDTKAIHYFQLALEKDSRRIQSLYELTRLMLKRQETTEALRLLQKHQKLVYDSPPLLTLAIDAARRAHRPDLETDYKEQTTKLNREKEIGAANEYDRANA